MTSAIPPTRHVLEAWGDPHPMAALVERFGLAGLVIGLLGMLSGPVAHGVVRAVFWQHADTVVSRVRARAGCPGPARFLDRRFLAALATAHRATLRAYAEVGGLPSRRPTRATLALGVCCAWTAALLAESGGLALGICGAVIGCVVLLGHCAAPLVDAWRAVDRTARELAELHARHTGEDDAQLIEAVIAMHRETMRALTASSTHRSPSASGRPAVRRAARRASQPARRA